jgi:tRNA threonylcarbamoyladenosine biosynthesis protein TsaB
MILLLDTSTYDCKLTLIDGDWRYDSHWQADRELAKGLLGYIQTQLQSQIKTWDDITALAVYKGPGSFTGLRIGITVMNTIADANSLSIVGETGTDWQSAAINRLQQGESDSIVLPEYGGEANITQPRK